MISSCERNPFLYEVGNLPRSDVEKLIASHQPKPYVRATTLLVDLRDIADRTSCGPAFARQLVALRATHPAEPSFLRQLRSSRLSQTCHPSPET